MAQYRAAQRSEAGRLAFDERKRKSDRDLAEHRSVFFLLVLGLATRVRRAPDKYFVALGLPGL